MSDIYMPEPNMQLVRDVRERREGRTQTSDGPLLDELVDALEAAMAKIREAETVIANVEDFVTRHYLDMRMGQAVLALTDAYKPTNQEGGNDGT